MVQLFLIVNTTVSVPLEIEPFKTVKVCETSLRPIAPWRGTELDDYHTSLNLANSNKYGALGETRIHYKCNVLQD